MGACTVVLSVQKWLKYLDFVLTVHRELTDLAALYINYRDSRHSTSPQVLIVLGISLANCHMTTRVLDVFSLMDGTGIPYHTILLTPQLPIVVRSVS